MPGENMKLWFGRAASPEEFEQIAKLNHETFTEEIPQHAPHDDHRLVDKFHMENTYLIGKYQDEVIGMIALRSKRPFSLDEKLPDLDRYLPAGKKVCEIRLLAVKKNHRRSAVFPGLVREVVRTCRERGLDYAVISGTTRQLKLYSHLGFEQFGPLVGKEGAWYQPMGLSIERFVSKVVWLDAVVSSGAENEALSLVPGPAQVTEAVRASAASRPIPHRSHGAMEALRSCRRALLKLTGAEDVQVMIGTGTLANDVIAQQLSLRNAPGIVFVNGEFGERLTDHCARAGLEFSEVRCNWGEPIDIAAARTVIRAGGSPAWLWMVHCETSTGVMNDLEGFKALAREASAEAVLDCVSTLGNVPVDLGGIALASGVSGKGLAALPGLTFVFYQRAAARESARTPRYLDLALYARSESAPFTHSSNLVAALNTALSAHNDGKYRSLAMTSSCVVERLEFHGFFVVGGQACRAPFVVTVALPPDIDSSSAGEQMRVRGFAIAFESEYLKRRNWIQFAWMGNLSAEQVLGAVDALALLCGRDGRKQNRLLASG